MAFKLIVGLGNPGRSYAATRHNIGFWWVDELARRLNASFAVEAKFFGETARAADLRLLKPTTFMNRSGQSVAALARFFDIAPEEILVAHDELDLTPGCLRLKQGGGNAGHNGLRDISAQLGSPNFWRLRFGIGHPRASENPEQPVADFVLKPPRLNEQAPLEQAIQRALDAWPLLAAGKMTTAMNVLHTDPAAASPASTTPPTSDKESPK